MSTHNIGFYEEISKIIFQLSSNTHLISSSGLILSLCLKDFHRDAATQLVSLRISTGNSKVHRNVTFSAFRV